MKKIRSIIFDLIFYSFSCSLLLVCLPFIWIFPRVFLEKIGYLWAKISLLLLKKIVGLKINFHNLQHIQHLTKNGPVIFACQHQSALDTILPYFFLNKFALVLKKELFYIPLIGLYHLRLNSIFVDRKRGILAIRHMLDKAKQNMSLKRSILIYPEGRRNMPEDPINCQPGIFFLYQKLNCPVIPISLNTGLFWRRRTLFKEPGTVNVTIENAIRPGMNKADFMHILNQSFERKNML